MLGCWSQMVRHVFYHWRQTTTSLPVRRLAGQPRPLPGVWPSRCPRDYLEPHVRAGCQVWTSAMGHPKVRLSNGQRYYHYLSTPNTPNRSLVWLINNKRIEYTQKSLFICTYMYMYNLHRPTYAHMFIIILKDVSRLIVKLKLKVQSIYSGPTLVEFQNVKS